VLILMLRHPEIVSVGFKRLLYIVISVLCRGDEKLCRNGYRKRKYKLSHQECVFLLELRELNCFFQRFGSCINPGADT